MPPLNNPKHEAFARALASGETADQAYVAAGFKENRGNASRLKSRESIRKRVADLIEARQESLARATDEAAERHSVTVESLIAEAEEARRGAIAAGQFAAAIAAIKEKGILSGKRIERSEVTQKRGIEQLNLAELHAIATGGSAPTDFDPQSAGKLSSLH